MKRYLRRMRASLFADGEVQMLIPVIEEGDLHMFDGVS